MQLIETIRPLLNDSRVPHPLETVSIEFILRKKEKNHKHEKKCKQKKEKTCIFQKFVVILRPNLVCTNVRVRVNRWNISISIGLIRRRI